MQIRVFVHKQSNLEYLGFITVSNVYSCACAQVKNGNLNVHFYLRGTLLHSLCTE